MSKPPQVELERLRYWQGQRLRARDFRDQLAIETQLRWWHNRALHNVFGVSLGFDVSPVLQSGTLTAVRVTCGLAYDCFGRELILQETREVPVPTAPLSQGNRQVTLITLLLRYKEAAQFLQRNDLAAVCLSCSGSSFQEEPDFVWKPTDGVQLTDGVPIAQVNFDNQQVIFDHQFREPISRPLARPYLASGATLSGHTVWEPWLVEVSKRPILIGLQTQIDTSAAGFTHTPCYFAWLQGALRDEQGQLLLFPYFANITEASPTGFIFRFLVPSLTIPDGPRDDVAAVDLSARERAETHVSAVVAGALLRGARRTTERAAQRLTLYVCWLGCEMEPRSAIVCPGSTKSQTGCQ
jgi:hypothetical protein